MLNIQFAGTDIKTKRNDAFQIVGSLKPQRNVTSAVIAQDDTGKFHVGWKFLGSNKNDSKALHDKAKANGWKLWGWDRGEDKTGRLNMVKSPSTSKAVKFSAYA